MYHSAQLFLAAALPTDAAGTQVIPGFLAVLVVGPEGLSLPGATVTTVVSGDPITEVTDADGRCMFVDLPPAKYVVRALLETFKPNTVSAAVFSDNTTDIMIRLQSAIVDDEDCSR